jgi:hypothetical protein
LRSNRWCRHPYGGVDLDDDDGEVEEVELIGAGTDD